MRPNLITRFKEEWNNLDPVDPLRGLIADAIDALAEQPAQQQEPVAWKDEQGNVRMALDAGEIQSSVGYVYSVHGERIKNACIRSDIPNGTPLYTSPPAQRKPLTDEQLWENDQIMSLNADLGWHMDTIRMFARAIEAAHGIKEDA